MLLVQLAREILTSVLHVQNVQNPILDPIACLRLSVTSLKVLAKLAPAMGLAGPEIVQDVFRTTTVAFATKPLCATLTMDYVMNIAAMEYQATELARPVTFTH